MPNVSKYSASSTLRGVGQFTAHTAAELVQFSAILGLMAFIVAKIERFYPTEPTLTVGQFWDSVWLLVLFMSITLSLLMGVIKRRHPTRRTLAFNRTNDLTPLRHGVAAPSAPSAPGGSRA